MEFSEEFETLSLGSTLRLLHKERRADRISHLRSIAHDAKFVALAHARLRSPPLFANLRCGLWYVSPAASSSGHCYFKSTDGHAGCWDFSLSRLNLQVALAAASSGSVVVVDSTRSGKSFPDALTKTLPIWCCVINRAVAAERADGAAGASTAPPSFWDTQLHLAGWIPPSEASQIEALLDGWVAALRRPALAPVLARLCAALDKPLRPGWLCPDANEPQRLPDGVERGARAAGDYVDQILAMSRDAAALASETAGDDDGAVAHTAPFAWVHCVCASEACGAEAARERASYTYIQGAGDDEENWARGLTAALWWRWSDAVLDLASRDPQEAEEELCRRLEDATAASINVPPATISSILICCERGDDRSATVAAAALLALYDATLTSLVSADALADAPARAAAAFSKEDVRARLALLQAAYPQARVSRGLTKELNNYFVAPNGGWPRMKFSAP